LGRSGILSLPKNERLDGLGSLHGGGLSMMMMLDI